MLPWLEQLDRDGYVLLRGVLDANAVARAVADCAAALNARAAADSVLTAERQDPGSTEPGKTRKAAKAYGARNLLRIWPQAVEMLRVPPLAAILAEVLGPRAGVVRGLFFDKPPGATWSLPWHRDRTIAVKSHLQSHAVAGRAASGRFKKPTVKAGVPHLEAPVELLDTMLTARVHLDAMTPRNGPLMVVPGSHRLECVEDDRAGSRPAETILCSAGDVLLMRPLLSHASITSAADCADHRRIVHLELSPTAELPDGYEWHDWMGLA